jgi:hypothetical protein
MTLSLSKISDSTARTGLIAAVISIAIVLFEVLPITITNTTMMVTTEASSSSSSTAIPKSVKGVKSPYIMAVSYGVKDSDEHTISVVHLSTLYVRTTNTEYGGATSKNNNSKKFVHSSIRIEEDVLKALQSEAQRREISYNSLVNKTLKNYVTSEMYFEQLGFILVSRDFLRKTFLKLDEKYLEEFGREIGLTVAKEYISYFSGQINTITLVEFLDIWFKRFQFYQHRIEDVVVTSSDAAAALSEKQQNQQEQIHLFIVIHDINMNFSLVLKSMLEGLVEPVTKSSVIFRDVTSSSIIFLIKI